MKEQFIDILHQIVYYDPNNPLFFTKLAFWVFFILVMGGYSLVYSKQKLRNTYLLIVSLFLYYQIGGVFLLLLCFSSVFNFAFGLAIAKQKHPKTWLTIGVLINLSFLLYYKYAYLFVDFINSVSTHEYVVYDYLGSFIHQLTGTKGNSDSILLPIGISFYTFQAISYLVDVKQAKVKAIRSLPDFAFFLCFFPQLVAGPIIRASAFVPQLYQKYKLREQEFGHASFLIVKGLVKKLVIADFLALNLVDRVFDAPWAYSGAENLMAAYAYAIQIYCDFSGYTDIAIGLALCMGFKIPINFNSPYHAINLTDFWRRWHISLSRWLRDYLYIPLGGNRKGKVRTYINLFVTMLLGGLWHGANVKFLIWGAIHGAGLSIEKGISSLRRGKKIKSRKGRLIAQILTFHLVTFAWIFFRANDFESILRMYNQITANFVPTQSILEMGQYIPVLIIFMLGVALISFPIHKKEQLRGWFIQQNWMVKSIVIILCMALIQQTHTSSSVPFIYFQF